MLNSKYKIKCTAVCISKTNLMSWCFVCVYRSASFTWAWFSDWKYQHKMFLFDQIIIFRVFDIVSFDYLILLLYNV